MLPIIIIGVVALLFLLSLIFGIAIMVWVFLHPMETVMLVLGAGILAFLIKWVKAKEAVAKRMR